MRSTVVRTLAELASEGVPLHLLTGDLGFKVLDPFREAHPNRFTNAGVAEANMISVAAGMALSGLRPVCYSMVPFVFFRPFESFRLDVVGHGLPVVLIGVGGGLSYGHEGVSHHAIEDVAIARSLPGLQVLTPGDPQEAALAVRAALAYDGPTFLRVGQNNDPAVHSGRLDSLRSPIPVAGASKTRWLFASGHILAAAVDARSRLAGAGQEWTLHSVPSVKPFDEGFLRERARELTDVVTIEEHSVVGGLGSLIAEVLLQAGFRGRFSKLGLPDAYCSEHGTLPWLRAHYRLDASSIAERILENHP